MRCRVDGVATSGRVGSDERRGGLHRPAVERTSRQWRRDDLFDFRAGKDKKGGKKGGKGKGKGKGGGKKEKGAKKGKGGKGDKKAAKGKAKAKGGGDGKKKKGKGKGKKKK